MRFDELTYDELKSFLDEKYDEYNVPGFIEDDPVSIPHQFEKKEDIEIAGFLAASIAWGNRKMIIRNATGILKRMGYYPHEFIVNASEDELDLFGDFVHRTFNGEDAIYFLKALQNIYRNHGGLEKVFTDGFQLTGKITTSLDHFRNTFLELPYRPRTARHVANVMSGSAAKRICMFLRWMARKDNRGVDFGLWDGIPTANLMLPLDVHTGNVSRKLGLLTRKSNDWKAVLEVTANLRRFDSNDPVKYDYALFGLGVSGII